MRAQCSGESNALSSGLQDPQFVPAHVAAPSAATLSAPPAIASKIVLRPTLKHAQTVAPASGISAARRPASAASGGVVPPIMPITAVRDSCTGVGLAKNSAEITPSWVIAMRTIAVAGSVCTETSPVVWPDNCRASASQSCGVCVPANSACQPVCVRAIAA